LGELTALPRSLALFKGPTSKGGRGRWMKGWKGSKGKGEGRAEEVERGNLAHPKILV